MTDNASPSTGGLVGLRERRVAARLSQQRVAELAECSIASVALLERGYQPRASTVLPRILRVLNVQRPADEPGAGEISGGGDAGHETA